MTFRVGQKVVCIKQPVVAVEWPWRAHPKEGCIYTVRGFRRADPTSLWLQEIVSEIGRSGEEAGFSQDRFRPLVEHKTDISVFTDILRKVSRKQGAEA